MSKVSAYEEFKDKLQSGELQPGQFITQKEFASLANVPIAAAREAIQKLEHESLLKVHPQRGIQIADVTLEFIRNAFGLRMILECDAVRQFAENADNRDVAQKLLDQTSVVLNEAKIDTGADILERAVEVDWRLHDEIIAGVRNKLVAEIYQINAARLRLIKTTNRLSPSRVVTALQEHVLILECCISNDSDGAAKAMQNHINTAMERAINGV
ncbi:GntR family transcriptional regulator [Ahrensia kielensis]|uniref:GntR family transcriptional regulator n=1 Tax=Ahrensia kielensis TaxID=76980 RepID=A0ABU9TB01_9HYPH